jgi:hypothetical protein
MPRSRPKVFLDTSVLKLAVARLIRARKRRKTIRWGNRATAVDLTQTVEVFPIEKLSGPIKRDALLLQIIARLAERGRIELSSSTEVQWEFFRLPRIDDPRGRFCGAPIIWHPTPKTWGRVIFDGRRPAREHQINYLKGLGDTRFVELQIAVGARQSSLLHDNELVDAFHIWTAETTGADYFLTCDYNLLKRLGNHRKYQPTVDVVNPNLLVKDLLRRAEIDYVDIAASFWHVLRTRARAGPNHPYEALLLHSEHLENTGYYDPE